MILDALQPIAEIVNKFIPDGAEKNRLQAELEKASLEVDKQRLGALSNMLGSNSFFVAGAIPSILWVLVISIINNYIIMPWGGMFGLQIPDTSMPDQVWTLAGWIITGLLAKKAVDGNAFYSKSGALIKPARSEQRLNTLSTAGPSVANNVYSESQVAYNTFEQPPVLEADEIMEEPDANIPVKDQSYYDARFEELMNKHR